MEHRGGDILLRESKGPVAQVRGTALLSIRLKKDKQCFSHEFCEQISFLLHIYDQAQRRPLGGFKRQAAQDDDVWPAKGSDADQPQIQDIQV